MATPISVPRLGWNMEQGVFVGWLKADGVTVRSGDSLFTLEGEKATEDVECLDAGVLYIPATGPKKGDVVLVGAIIGYLLQAGEAPPVHEASLALPRARAEATRTTTAFSNRDRPASSPRARRAAKNLGVDWARATATGRSGRIRERDVLALSPAADPAPSKRRLIAERMLMCQRSTAPVTLTTTVDATELVRLRNRLKGTVTHGEPVPSFTDLFIHLAAAALERHPALNSRWENDQVVPQSGIHIGIAVDTESGLLVPVLRDVPKLSLRNLAAQSRALIERARSGQISANELRGGTFTVTSLGSLGIDAFTPIINYPECAILGIGRIRRCPAVVDDEIVIRDQATLSLTFDHRIVDGAPAARFLQTLTGLIEKPPGQF